MNFALEQVLTIISSLGAVLAAWIAMNTKVTKLETLTQVLKEQSASIRPEFNTLYEEIKSDQKEIMKVLNELRILIEKKADK